MLKPVEHWKLVENQLNRNFVFSNFDDAFEFMRMVAYFAKEMDHHPKWINYYNKVEINISSEGTKLITQLDIDLAVKINEIFENKNDYLTLLD